MAIEDRVEAGLALLGVNEMVFLRCVGMWGLSNDPVLVLQCAETLRLQGSLSIDDDSVAGLGGTLLERWHDEWRAVPGSIRRAADPRSALRHLLAMRTGHEGDAGIEALLWSVGALREAYR